MATINPEKLTKFFEDNPEISAKLDAEEAEKKKTLSDLDTLAKLLETRAKELESRIKFLEERSLENSPAYTSAVNTYMQLINQSNDVSKQAVEIMKPQEPKPEGDIITFPDNSDPSGESEVTFPPGRINEITRTPETLQARLTELQNSDSQRDQLELKALTHMLGEEVIAEGTAPSTSPTLSIDGTDATFSQPRDTGIESRAKEFGGIAPSFEDVPENIQDNPRGRALDARIKENISRTQKRARFNTQNLGGGGTS